MQPEITKSLSKANAFGINAPKAINVFSNVSKEVEIIKEVSSLNEIASASDEFSPIERRILIAVHTYGAQDAARAAAWTGISLSDFKKVIQDNPKIQQALRNGTVPCWTKAELVSRLCVEAETATKAQERILAITKLMEYRGLAQPEGGARSFERTVAKFKVEQ